MPLFKEFLLQRALGLHNYAHRGPSECDLSLISGPFIWENEISTVLSNVPNSWLQQYALPGENIELLEILAAHEGVNPDWLLLVPGADLAIEIILKQYLSSGDHVGILIPNFPRFEIVVGTFRDLQVNYFEDITELPPDMRLVAICSPCNPSTREILEQNLREVIASNPETLFCLDCVFDWYTNMDLVKLCLEFRNVVVMKSFSKIGLAGLRLGFVVAQPENISYLRVGMSPFTVPALTQMLGLAVARNLHRVSELRQLLTDRFSTLSLKLGSALERHSEVPFYLLHTKIESTRATQLLMGDGISVVDGAEFRGLGNNTLRVAIGDHGQNQTFLAAVRKHALI